MLKKINRLLGLSRDLLHYKDKIRPILNINNIELEYFYKRDQMMQYAINSQTMGVTTDRILPSDLIVSLTSYGDRLKYAALSIESIMQGTMKPNKIVLSISEKHKGSLPILLQKQQQRGLEILYCKDIRSYTKLIPVLRKYPEAFVITIDDDCIYNQDLVENLVNASINNPNEICANRVHRITFNDNGNIKKYNEWKHGSNIEDASYLNFLTGVGGVLYPPHSLFEEVTDETTFLDICRYADDVWFFAMAVKKGTLIRKTNTYNNFGDEFVWNPSHNDGLNNINVLLNANDIQIQKVFKKYDIMSIIKTASHHD